MVRDQNKKLYVFYKGKNKSSKRAAKYIVLKMKIDDSLKVRPISTDGKSYAILYTVEAGNYGISSDLPFFTESLSYTETKKSAISVRETKYGPSQAFLGSRDQFMTIYYKALAGDVWSLVKTIAVAICMWILAMSWFAYCVVTQGIGRKFFEVLTLRGKNGRTGIDLIKPLTLWIYSLDSDLPLSRTVVVSMVCTIILYIILNILT